jgi:hypothetical protein
MDSRIFLGSLLVAGACFASFILISALGSLLGKTFPGPSRGKAGAMMMKLSFALFVIFGFSLVPLLVGSFIALLKDVVPVPIGLIEENDMLIVCAFWAAYAIGLAMAIPAMIKGGFFKAENKP